MFMLNLEQYILGETVKAATEKNRLEVAAPLTLAAPIVGQQRYA